MWLVKAEVHDPAHRVTGRADAVEPNSWNGDKWSRKWQVLEVAIAMIS